MDSPPNAGPARKPTSPRVICLGGIGKKRLGPQVAHRAMADFADSVAFVPLAPVGDPSLVCLAHALLDERQALPPPASQAPRPVRMRRRSRGV